MRYLILVASAVLAVSAPTAQAQPVKVDPFEFLQSVKVSGKNVRFDFAISFLPNPTTCTGKVTASHKLKSKKTVKWSGKLKSDNGACTTTIHAKLPKANYGKKRKFKFTFPGNDAIKKFSDSATFKLVPPKSSDLPPGLSTPVTHGPQSPGKWFMFKKNDSGDSGWSFTIKPDYTVPALIRPGNLTMNCAVGGNTSMPFYWNNTDFGMGTAAGSVQSGGNGVNIRNMVHTLNWSFTGPNAGTGHFSSVGEFRYQLGENWTQCSTDFDVTFSGGNP